VSGTRPDGLPDGGRAGEAGPPGRKMLRILMLEDQPADAELAQRQLARDGLSCTSVVVDTRAGFEEQLTALHPDVILSDYNVPGFSGQAALTVAREQCPQIPFIFLSGVLGDDAAVELIKQGAADFVLKDRPARLVLAIQRAIGQSEQAERLSRLEAELSRAARLASIGRLAAGVAHEFNSQVGAMVNFAGFIREEAAARAASGGGDAGWAEVRDDAEQIEQAGHRVLQRVGQLLAAGGQQLTRGENLDLNDVVHDAEPLLRSTLGERIPIRMRLGAGLWPVTADPGQVRLALLNLVLNAKEAMPDGGACWLVTENTAMSADEAARHPSLAAGNYVSLSVRDNGMGMEPDVAEHAFEPFFSTKPFVEGGGLGLAIVYGIVSQAGGAVELSSTPGTGTTVTWWLPVSAGDRECPPPS